MTKDSNLQNSRKLSQKFHRKSKRFDFILKPASRTFNQTKFSSTVFQAQHIKFQSEITIKN
jgi:hypothetical protein